MDRSLGAKKYFIEGFKEYIKNTHRSLSKIYTPSIRELLLDYVEIHEDIISNLELEKLGNARRELIEAIQFYIKNSILLDGSPFTKELNLLMVQMNKINEKEMGEKALNYSHVYNICNSLIKKIDSSNIYLTIVELVKNYRSFIEAEKAIHFIINELMYEGYSLKYLDSWVTENLGSIELSTENVDFILNKFGKFKKSQAKYTYYINVYRNEIFKEDELYIDFNLSLIKKNFETLNFGISNGKPIKGFLQISEDYHVCEIQVESMDYFKGLEQILSSINSYFQMIDYVTNEKKKLYQDKIICKFPNGSYKKIRITDDIPEDTKILFSKLENRERQDVEDFILYRERVFCENINSQEVFNVQRALNIVKSQLHQSEENKIINLWAVLEYILTFKEAGGSIISKVKDIVPKVICLYIMKDKINNFWSGIYEYKDENIEIVNAFMECKKENEEYQYDLSALIDFILRKGHSLAKELEFNNSLVRGISEIGQFLTAPKRLNEYLNIKMQEIKHDLVRSYRARNVLIHSGKETRANLNFKALRLYCYNNNLLGLLIYYLCKNPQYKITEVLNSIDYTFENYMVGLQEGNIPKEEICKPNYLFIG
ncbi:hypothetical protein [Paenibacillus cucumis (ex Kampfer et al. 2016)]|uniref:Apea-like HEPN domain-containing protein n=1 Tax=Paenibacillus cucumis (ex Kampfer et al. 2016) TaxID=1776858 RepID=A0ABS7KNC8_9BACL|nr:hypothetical protein [Paenibacillus cucumis (ex Kampfer et al. 2016)]MBY0205672.1 hypothetical protein [Paenibacillus cucumis (ex Kampfer et al. 2016)]